jgi:hypothetical protein
VRVIEWVPDLDYWSPPEVPPTEVDLVCDNPECGRKGRVRAVDRAPGVRHVCPGPWTERPREG